MNGLEGLPGLKTENGEPVFAEPWEANAFALAVALHEKGVFEWTEWAAMLGEVIADSEPDTPYYENWLTALERIVTGKSLLNGEEMEVRRSAWQAALKATPHGQPIELQNGAGRPR